MQRLPRRLSRRNGARTCDRMGLGRVITRRRGCRRTATGGMYCKVTVSSMFSDFGLEAIFVVGPS